MKSQETYLCRKKDFLYQMIRKTLSSFAILIPALSKCPREIGYQAYWANGLNS